ncbi:hypothetical protein [Clostridium sp. FP1]|uniref:hypothetical protein n=1 Tax=Clostridium sp. FP1 TaxID=2724076 RepID=UPI0013E99998|nr:hypothetical protein [Clostridium sp. FP1]MBZ9633027.1 hypothetical protein [Clostridium sp. FP1]MBZ9633152.1 hypothetical protein [Clostridium sp. FP1]
MSTFAKIKCLNCGNSYEIYRDSSIDKPVNCPHCYAEIDETMWKQLVDAIGAVADLNQHFHKYHLERNEDLFSASFENVYVPSDKSKT